MVEYTDLTLLVRQVANGAMAISAVFILVVFGQYLWHNWSARHSVSFKAAVAIFILTAGHLIRSASSWLEFILIDVGIDPDELIVISWSWFLLAVILVLIGKALMLLNFAPWENRKRWTAGAICCAIGIPIIVAMIT